MDQNVSYKSTIAACYAGNFTQAIIVNLTPVLFIPLREQFGFSFSQLGLLVLINFFTQVIIDLLFSTAVDRYGFRVFVVTAHIIAAAGLALFALTPIIAGANAYPLFVGATVLFSAGGGLLELLLSPIVNAVPTKEKAAAMSVLHSFYCWGQVAVVLVTTVFLYLFSKQSWPYIMLLWAIIPVLNAILFSTVPLAPGVAEAHRLPARDMVKNPLFIACFFSIMFGGAAEISISQWSSTFMEAALGIPKVIGDTAGMCLFAVMMGIGRLHHGISGKSKTKKKSLRSIMLAGGALSFCCYLVVALSPVHTVSLLACALCGLGVSLLWPGTLSLAAEHFPMAGAWMFAVLAAAGDIGASAGPSLVGFASDYAIRFAPIAAAATRLGLSDEQMGLRIGVLIASVFPLGSLLVLRFFTSAPGRSHRPS